MKRLMLFMVLVLAGCAGIPTIPKKGPVREKLFLIVLYDAKGTQLRSYESDSEPYLMHMGDKVYVEFCVEGKKVQAYAAFVVAEEITSGMMEVE